MSTKTEAQWSISLDCDCPHCKEFVDLLEYPDFWDGRRLDVGEHHTDRSQNVSVTCPNCGSDFEVDLVY